MLPIPVVYFTFVTASVVDLHLTSPWIVGPDVCFSADLCYHF
jgi:acyl-CoA hydrolase